MVNNGEKPSNTKYTLDDEYIICAKCKVCYKPENKDISLKNPNVYYKTCQRCRDYQFQKKMKNRYKNKNL
jgi:hypothetical protein